MSDDEGVISMSELARHIARRMLVAKAQGKFDQEYSSALELLIPEVDEALQEVHSVLSLTADRRMEKHGHCWCYKDLTDNKEPHDDFCQRARRVYEQLSAAKESTNAD